MARSAIEMKGLTIRLAMVAAVKSLSSRAVSLPRAPKRTNRLGRRIDVDEDVPPRMPRCCPSCFCLKAVVCRFRSDRDVLRAAPSDVDFLLLGRACEWAVWGAGRARGVGISTGFTVVDIRMGESSERAGTAVKLSLCGVRARARCHHGCRVGLAVWPHEIV